MDPQFKQRGEHLTAEVAAVGQLLLVRPDMLQKLIQLLESLGAGLQHTLINLQGSRYPVFIDVLSLFILECTETYRHIITCRVFKSCISDL